MNATKTPSEFCASVTGNTHDITVSCADAGFIHECPPLYISVTSNATGVSYQCTGKYNTYQTQNQNLETIKFYNIYTTSRILFSDPACRFSNMIKYTVSYENLLCTSGASKIAFNSLILFIILSFVTL